VSVFLDTSVLLAGLIDFGPQSAPAQTLLHAVAERTIDRPSTAWHCCLEFYSVGTRLPPEFRLSPAEAERLLTEEVFPRMDVHGLPAEHHARMLQEAVQDRVAGGRIYDSHIAWVAKAAGARIIVTDNRRHFLTALRHGVRVETPPEFLSALRAKRP
jgi:predicted nucleic acid-binding protein